MSASGLIGQIAALVLFVYAAHGQNNFVSNGGFEDPVVPESSPLGPLLGVRFYPNIPGWGPCGGPCIQDPLNNCIEVERWIVGAAYEGRQLVELDSVASTSICQEITTDASDVCQLCFAFSGRPNSPASENHVEVRWDGVVVADRVKTTTSATTDWEVVCEPLLTGGTKTLMFSDLGATSDAFGTFIDDVQVLCSFTPLPTNSPTVSATPSHTPTATVSLTPSTTPSITPTPSATNTLPATPTQTPTSAPPLDHFSCYRVIPQGIPNFPGFTGLSLVDRFGSKTANSSNGLRRLCAPTNKNNEDPTAPSHPIHLEAHKVVQLQPPAPLIENLVLQDQFGTLHVNLRNAEWLLTPTLKVLQPAAPPPPPALVNSPVDHFLCYRITPNGAPFPTHNNVTVQDQFLQSTVRLRARWFCTPVNKNGEDPTAPTHQNQLTCYRQRPPLQQPASPTFAWVHPQFGPERLRVRRRSMVCVPSVVLNPCLSSCDGGPDNGTPCADDCPGGTCVAGVCTAGSRVGQPCVSYCPGGTCEVPDCCCQPAGLPACISSAQCSVGESCGCP